MTRALLFTLFAGDRARRVGAGCMAGPADQPGRAEPSHFVVGGVRPDVACARAVGLPPGRQSRFASPAASPLRADRMDGAESALQGVSSLDLPGLTRRFPAPRRPGPSRPCLLWPSGAPSPQTPAPRPRSPLSSSASRPASPGRPPALRGAQ